MGGFSTMVWLPAHLTIGAALLALTLVRIVWRFLERRALYGSLPARSAALAVHVAIYLVLLAVMATGWIVYRPMPLMPPVSVAGVVTLPVFPFPSLLPPLPYATLHRVLTWVLVGLLVLHISAAAIHALFRDGVVGAMIYRRGRE